jgi:hypothetical protein
MDGNIDHRHHRIPTLGAHLHDSPSKSKRRKSLIFHPSPVLRQSSGMAVAGKFRTILNKDIENPSTGVNYSALGFAG